MDAINRPVLDSGTRKTFDSGMQRDACDKIRYHRVVDGPMLRRWGAHLHKANKKYPDVKPGVANWLLAEGQEEYQRARESAYGHFMDWFEGKIDEDHAAAIFFNINLAEYCQEKMNKKTNNFQLAHLVKESFEKLKKKQDEEFNDGED